MFKSLYLNKDLKFYKVKPVRIFIFFIVLFGLMFALFIVNKPHRDIGKESAMFKIKSDTLVSHFLRDETTASTKYLDQTIEVSGMVTEINMNFLTIDGKIYCKFDDKITTISLNTYVKVKGRCIGFDELLEQVKLDQCTLQN